MLPSHPCTRGSFGTACRAARVAPWHPALQSASLLVCRRSAADMQTALMRCTSAPVAALPVCQPRLPQRSRLQIVQANKETSSGNDSYSRIEAPGVAVLLVPCCLSLLCVLACFAEPQPALCPAARPVMAAALTTALPAVRGEVPDGGPPVAGRDDGSQLGELTKREAPAPDQEITGSDIRAADAFRFLVRPLSHRWLTESHAAAQPWSCVQCVHHGLSSMRLLGPVGAA